MVLTVRSRNGAEGARLGDQPRVAGSFIVLRRDLIWTRPIASLATLWPNASWVWPDPARRAGYLRVSALCGALLAVALVTADGITIATSSELLVYCCLLLVGLAPT